MNIQVKTLFLQLLLTAMSFFCVSPVTMAYDDQANDKVHSQERGYYDLKSSPYFFEHKSEFKELFKYRENLPEYWAHHGKRHFEDLTPEQREQLRLRRDAFQALPKEERDRIYKAREKFQQMPPEKRERLKEKWLNMSPEERKKARKRKYKHRD